MKLRLSSIADLLKARWVLPVLLSVVGLVGAAIGWGWLRGYESAEENYLQQLNTSLASQIRRERARSEMELKLVIKNEREKNEAQERIDAVSNPAVSCALPTECVQWYDDILRAGQGDIGGVD